MAPVTSSERDAGKNDRAAPHLGVAGGESGLGTVAVLRQAARRAVDDPSQRGGRQKVM